MEAGAPSRQEGRKVGPVVEAKMRDLDRMVRQYWGLSSILEDGPKGGRKVGPAVEAKARELDRLCRRLLGVSIL
jgi:hypothetical protein